MSMTPVAVIVAVVVLVVMMVAEVIIFKVERRIHATDGRVMILWLIFPPARIESGWIGRCL